MSFEKRPAQVDKSIKAGDVEAIHALARAGGEATAKRWDEKHAWDDMEKEMHLDSMDKAAQARGELDPELRPSDL